MKRYIPIFLVSIHFVLFIFINPAFGASAAFKENIYNPGQLKPIDSTLKVKVGDLAPDFTLPAVSGEKITLSQYRGKKNVVISFVPAAWTPVCSDQWPGYNIVKEIFEKPQVVKDKVSTIFTHSKAKAKPKAGVKAARRVSVKKPVTFYKQPIVALGNSVDKVFSFFK